MENKDAWIWVIALIIAIFLFGGIGMYGMMGYGMMGYAPLFGMGFGWVFMLLFLGALVWFVYALVSQPGSKNDAMSILKKRYAAGEITKKQYEEMKKRDSVKMQSPVFFIDVDRTLASFAQQAGEKAVCEFLSKFWPREVAEEFPKVFLGVQEFYHGDRKASNLELVNKLNSYVSKTSSPKFNVMFSRELYIKYLSEKHQLKISDSQITEAAEAYWAAIAKNSRIYDDSIRFLESGKDAYIIAGTDGWVRINGKNIAYDAEYSKEKRLQRTKAIGLSKYFSDGRIIIGDPHDKPSEEFWKTCTNVAHLASPKSGIVIDDSITIVASAKQFGFKGILIDRAGRYDKEDVKRKTDEYITNFDELKF